MAWELLRPKRGPKKMTGKVISITKTQVKLSDELIEDWPTNCNALHIRIDKEAKKISLQPKRNTDSNTVTLSLNKKTKSRYFQSKLLLKYGVKQPQKIVLMFDKKNSMYIGDVLVGKIIVGKIN